MYKGGIRKYSLIALWTQNDCQSRKIQSNYNNKIKNLFEKSKS